MNKIFFGNQTYEADDVIKVLRATYSEDRSIYPDDASYEYSKQTQKHCFDVMLPKILRKYAQENFLEKFIDFCTGSSYLPHWEANQDFKIWVAFDPNLGATHLPKSKTCANQLILPVACYCGELSTMEEKMKLALDNNGKSYGEA